MAAQMMMSAVMAVTVARAGEEIPLRENDMPGKLAAGPEKEEAKNEGGVLRITQVSKPSLTLFLLEETEQPAPLIVICPGGGYNILAFDKEGTEIAEWLNSIGVHAAVLKYRVPDNRDGALEDARQAIRMVRSRSGAWNVDPEKIGMLGFSAGGHLTAACSASRNRPDFSILVYPAYLFREGGIELIDDIEVDRNTPPAFVVQTLDDTHFYRSALAYSAALDAKGIPCELHLFAKGGHGYGMRDRGHPVNRWPDLCESWLRESGFLE